MRVNATVCDPISFPRLKMRNAVSLVAWAYVEVPSTIQAPSTPHAPSTRNPARGTVLLAEGLDRQVDLHLVADQESAGLERRVPLEAEVFPVQRDFGFEANLVVAPRILRLAKMRDGQRDLLRDA